MTIAQTASITPDRVIELARSGEVPKLQLADLLNVNARKTFLDFCASIEKRYTEACTAQHEPCLEGGCALEGEVCLQPLERAHPEYERACGNAFVELYLDPRNRA
ncbi:MAG TPA: hypothetical protein VFB07_10720 [Vicinamibacterales bacterium]|nr:hypothetical protein [Vicinamibacterales bacterium]